MSYIRAEEILPINVIELIQQYVDGQNLYIPRKSYLGLFFQKQGMLYP